MRSKFLGFEKKNSKAATLNCQLPNERGSFNKSEAREYEDECIEDKEETDISTQFLRIQKNQLIDLMQHLERYTSSLALFGFNIGRYDMNLIKSYLITYLINGKILNLQLSRKQTVLFRSNWEEVFGLSYYV